MLGYVLTPGSHFISSFRVERRSTANDAGGRNAPLRSGPLRTAWLSTAPRRRHRAVDWRWRDTSIHGVSAWAGLGWATWQDGQATRGGLGTVRAPNSEGMLRAG